MPNDGLEKLLLFWRVSSCGEQPSLEMEERELESQTYQTSPPERPFRDRNQNQQDMSVVATKDAIST